MGEPGNFSDSEMQIIHYYSKNRRVSERTFYALIIAYSVLIFIGVCGNILVVWVVLRKPAMRTARNLFILNLAISDLLLCLVNMPLTLIDIVTRYWPFGDNAFVCKLIGASQAVSVFVSSFSITAIALDRYQLIVNPTRDSLQRVGAIFSLLVIWILSLLMASPSYIIKNLEFPANTTQVREHFQLDILAFCIEDWPIVHGGGIYSGVTLIIQYVLPILTVSVAYFQICRKLQYRHVAARASTTRRRSRDDRRRRTNSLLVAISVVFCVSWLPLNVFNLIQDFKNLFGNDNNTMMVVYASCHMAGMSSACSNPLLYGWLNDNFRKEFKEILAMFWPFSAGNSGPLWLQSFRSSLSRRKSKNKSSSGGEKISVKAKGGSDVEDGSLYIDEMKSRGEEKGLKKPNETMTTSLDNCDYTASEAVAEEI